MYVCRYVYIDVCGVYICVYKYTCIYMSTYICTCVCIYMCVCICIYMCIYIYMCVCVLIYMYTCVYIYIYTHEGAFNKFPDFFVQAFKIVVDS